MNGYWKQRIENIQKQVSLRSVVDLFGIFCQSPGPITQLHCPFHGSDQHASARIYETNTMYCWVCGKLWNVISFVKDFKHISFSESCSFLEDAFNLKKLDRIETQIAQENLSEFVSRQKKESREKDFDKEFQKISNLIISNRDHFPLMEYTHLFRKLDSAYNSYMFDENFFDSDIEKVLKTIRDSIPNY